MKSETGNDAGVGQGKNKPIAAKKLYKKPDLRVYGKLHHLTQKSGGALDGAAARKA